MEYLLYNSQNEIVGMRGSIPKKGEGLHYIELNEVNQSIYESCVNPKIVNGKIVSGEIIKVVQDEISASNFFINLKLILGFSQSDIIDKINSIETLPQINKDIAIIKLEKETKFYRADETLNAIAEILKITKEQLDNLFI